MITYYSIYYRPYEFGPLFYNQKCMQFAINLVIAFTLLQIAQQNTPCFYTHFFTIFEGQSTVKTYNAAGYQFPLTWATAQTSIIASSYVLMGFKLQNSYKELSYTSSLSSVTSSGATFNFNPHQSRSQIVVAHFSAIIVKNCGVEIYLKYIRIDPYIIDDNSRDDDQDDQLFDISVGFTFSDTKWKYSVMISSFSLSLDDDKMELQLSLYDIEVGEDYHRLKLISEAQQNNEYHQIWVTYLLMKQPSLKKQEYLYSFSSTTSKSTLSSQSTFFPDAFNKCVFGLSRLKTDDIDSSPTSLIITKVASTSGPSLFTVTEQRITSVKYQIVCLGKCMQADKYPKYATSSYACDTCSAILSNCLTCNSSNYCLSCNEGYYSDPSANNTCTICPSPCTVCSSKSYCSNCTNSSFLSISTPNQTCISCLPECLTCIDTVSCQTCKNGSVVSGGCTDDPPCIAVNNTLAFGTNRCLECILPTYIAQAGICECNQVLGFKSASGLCTNVTGCDTASQVSNQTVCQTCSTASNYKSALQNGSCVCANGFYMVSPGMNQTCIACRPQCSTCDNGASCLTCLTGWLVEGGCTQQTGCIKVDSSLLFTDLRCLQCRSNGSYLLVGGKCDCVTGFYLVDQLCTPVKGCATAVDSAGVVSCTSCDVSRLFIPIIKNGICACLDRLYLPTPPQQTTCSSCLADCELCTNSLTCTKCIEGTAVEGGCTIDSGCIQVDSLRDFSTNRCLACELLSNFRLVSGSCICLQGFIQLNRVCTNVTGCIAAKRKNDSVVCVNCNVVFNFLTAPRDNQCLCKDGFQLKNSVCVQICGDGKRFTYRCDDGNKVSGDGCSLDCQIEPLFDCYGQQTLPSACVYLKYDIQIQLINIDKVLFKNTGIFTFKLTPNLKIFDKLNITSVSFSTNRSHAITSISQNGEQIILQVDFQEDLQEFPAMLRVTLDRSLFLQKEALLHFHMISSGQKLIIVANEGQIQQLSFFFKGITLISLAVFILSLFSHKMIGAQLIHNFQVIFFVHLINTDYTSPFSVLAQLANSGLNILFAFNQNSNVQTSFQKLIFDSSNQNMSLYIIIATVTFPLLILIIICLAKKINHQGKNTNQAQGQQKRQKFENLLKLIYNRLLFPFCMVDLLVFFLILVNKSKNYSGSNSLKFRQSNALDFTLILIAAILSFVFFFQLESLLAKKRKSFPSINGIPDCNKHYIGAYLVFFFATIILISSRCILSQFVLQQFLAIIYFAFFLYSLVKKPYQRAFHNIGIIINSFTTLVFLIWCNLRSFIEPINAENSQILALYAILGLLLLSCACSLIRVLLEMKGKCKCSTIEKQQQLEPSKKKGKPPNLSINCDQGQSQKSEVGDQNILKYQREYLKKFELSKNVLMMNGIPNNFFQKRKNSSAQLNQNELVSYNLREQFLRQPQDDHQAK